MRKKWELTPDLPLAKKPELDLPWSFLDDTSWRFCCFLARFLPLAPELSDLKRWRDVETGRSTRSLGLWHVICGQGCVFLAHHVYAHLSL
jgi:hypothetical protein